MRERERERNTYLEDGMKKNSITDAAKAVRIGGDDHVRGRMMRAWDEVWLADAPCKTYSLNHLPLCHRL